VHSVHHVIKEKRDNQETTAPSRLFRATSHREKQDNIAGQSLEYYQKDDYHKV